MKNLLLSILLFLGLGVSSASAEIKLGLDSSPYPPFADQDASGTRTGFEIDLAAAICSAMKEKCVWVPIAWDGIIPALNAGKIDAIFGSMSITEKRQKVINFSNKYYNTPAAIVARKDSSITGTPSSVSGKIVGVQVSTTHADYAKKHFGGAEIKTYQAFDEHNNDLVAGRVDAVVADSLSFSDFLSSSGGSCCEIKGSLSDESIFGDGVGVGLRKSDTDLQSRFNAAIDQVRSDGTYDRIAKKYFDFDIYGD